jgi:hypothetical protein
MDMAEETVKCVVEVKETECEEVDDQVDEVLESWEKHLTSEKSLLESIEEHIEEQTEPKDVDTQQEVKQEETTIDEVPVPESKEVVQPIVQLPQKNAFFTKFLGPRKFF